MSARNIVPLIPRSLLFGNPNKIHPRISPDGIHLAYLAPAEGVLNIWIRTLSGIDDRALTHDTDRPVRLYWWSHDNTHILYLQDVGGDEDLRLYAVNLATGQTRDVIPFPRVQVRLIAADKNHPDDLLVAVNHENSRLHDAYHLHLPTGTCTLVAKNPGDVNQWLADPHFVVRGAWVMRSDGGTELRVRDDMKGGAWRTVGMWDKEDASVSYPIGFSANGASIYLIDARDANTSCLIRLDLANGHRDVIAADPQYDISTVLVHPDTHAPQAALFSRVRTEWLILDDTLCADLAAMQLLNPGNLSVVSRDDADRTWTIGFTTDNGPAAYYAFDRETKTATFLFTDYPELEPYTLAAMEPFAYTARDGLNIHGYLSFPPSVERFRLPTVLLVHGGPWTRDEWGFRPEAQWLANRGYLCVQVNFRGSSGYGKTFLSAGNREWGAKMHDDLVDAVEWVVNCGYADLTRLGIMGTSYGGYAALVGATFTPHLFRCAVDVVGPSNLITLMRTIPSYWSPMLAIFRQRIGDPDTNEEFLKSRSPLFKVDCIRIPVLIAQGANDSRVKRAESDQIVAAMEHNGVEYEYIVFPDEGHRFAKPENRLQFYAAVEKFLAKHLGGRFEGTT